MRRALVIALVGLVAVVAVGILAVAGWPASSYRDNDFFGFWAGSRALLEGRDPYDVNVWLALHTEAGSRGLAIVPPRTGFGYPFTTALVFAPFALLPVSVAAPAWLVAQVVAVLAGLYALGRVLFAETMRRDLLVLTAFALGAQPVWLMAAGGNVGGFLFAIAAFATVLLLSGRDVAAGAVAGLLVVKPHPLLLAIVLLLIVLPRARTLAMVRGGAVTAGVLVALSVLLRPGWIGEWLVSVGRIADAQTGRATLFGLLPADLRLVGIFVVALIVVLFVRRAHAWRTSLVVGVAVPLSLFCAAYGWSYDETLLLMPVAIAIGFVANAPTAIRIVALIALALSVDALGWLAYWVAFRRGDEALTAAVPLVVLAAVLFAHSVASRPGAERNLVLTT